MASNAILRAYEMRAAALAFAARLSRTHAALAAMPVVIAGAFLLAPAPVGSTGSTASQATVKLPPIQSLSPLALRPVSAEQAIAINRAIPFDSANNAAAEPFAFKGAGENRDHATDCMTAAVYYEAASEGADGQRAVAQVVLNRVRHPAYPSTVCGVVFQGALRPTGCQFSFTCDKSLLRRASPSGWAEARKIAEAALSGAVFRPVGLATHYHANYVVPYWANRLAKNAAVGAHIFYRFPGPVGTPKAFRQAHSGAEGNFAMLRAAALMSKASWAELAPASPSNAIKFAVDPSVELVRIVEILGREPSSASTPYERDVRLRFADFTAHPAVPMLRDAIAGDADLAALMIGAAEGRIVRRQPSPETEPPAADEAPLTLDDALADFARQSEFEAFYAAHRKQYQAAANTASLLANEAARDWSAYSGLAPAPMRPLLLPRQGFTRCRTDAGLDGGPVDVRTETLAMALAQSLDVRSASPTSRSRATAKQTGVSGLCEAYALVDAVFARIAALSAGGSTSGRSSRFTAGLRRFEGQRAEYPQLSAFLPRLMAEIGSAKRAVASVAPAAAPACDGEPAAAANGQPAPACPAASL